MSFRQASDRASSTPTEFVEFALIVDLSVLQIRSTSCVHGRDFARSGEKRILGVTFKENPIGMNSNGVRASSFFPSSSPSSYLLPPRGGMFLSRGL